MSVPESLASEFKPETRVSGEKLFRQEKVAVAYGNDSSAAAFVRGSTPVRVSFKTDGIASAELVAECACAIAKRGTPCKHLWAALVGIAEKAPDFLRNKRRLLVTLVATSPVVEEKRNAAKTAARERRRAEYQRLKSQKRNHPSGTDMPSSKVRSPLPSLAPEVEAALRFFSDNGFPMDQGPSESILGEAKRKLSRVFHPDKGGSHEESIALNEHADTLRRYLRGE